MSPAEISGFPMTAESVIKEESRAMSDTKIQIFTSQDGAAQLQVALDQETVWLSQA